MSEQKFMNFCEKYPSVVFADSINPDWYPLLTTVCTKNEDTLGRLNAFLSNIRERDICPAKEYIWRFTRFCSPKEVKVIIMGQDPYPKMKYVMGFSVDRPRNFIPYPVKTIYEEVWEDITGSQYASSLKGYPPEHGCLESWAKQGVLIMDTVLTVTEGESGSHKGQGWEEIVGSILEELQGIAERNERPLVFMLWGRQAWVMEEFIKRNFDGEFIHKVLTAGHPSPNNELDDFRGCRHFSKANDFLVAGGTDAIDWSLPKNGNVVTE